jgi:photosystem II stability/assembly factor-like uncharacterized protein
MRAPSLSSFLSAVILLISLGTDAWSQARTTTQPQFKGILEPVSYSEDLDLRHVFFVNGEVGWVAGKAGSILRTVDAGKTWEAQLGGDPEDKAPPVRELHFIDERRGWAIQGEAGVTWKTLFTRDGESWEEIGTAPYGASSMAFTSPTTGFVVANPSMSVSGAHVIYRTTDGGRTWKPVWECAAKMTLGGLTRNFSCVLGQMQFPTPEVGYATATAGCMGMGCGGPPMLVKTTDGGETWSVMVGPGVLEEDNVSGLFFLDANTGFVRLASKKLHVTQDGGATWRGIVAQPGSDLRFADPTVAWAVDVGWSELRLAYSTDGGNRWSSRSVRVPATTRAFSFPRRDRAYIVGDHGMVLRYSVVPAAQPLGPNDAALPAMPGFSSPLDEQVEQLEQFVAELGSALAKAPDAADSAASAASAPDSAAGWAAADSAAAAAADEPFDAPLSEPSPYMANCCKQPFSRLEVVLGALSQTLPEFIGKYRNLNMLLAAVRIGAELPGEYRAVKGGLRAFRKASNKEEAQGALAGVSAALSALKQTTAVSMQQQLPPPPGDEPDAAAAPNAMMSPATGAPAALQVVGDSARSAVKDSIKEATDKAKKALGGLLRRKKP